MNTITEPGSVPIMRTGDKIIIPDAMPYAVAREWLLRQEQAEEKQVQIMDFIPCFPLDGVVALARVLADKFGFTALSDRDGMWGPEPPLLVQIPTPNGIETAILGKLQPPKWEGGYLSAEIGSEAQLKVTGQIKRKFESEVKEIISRLRTMLKENSIYRKQAMMVDLSWIREERRFHPINDAPKFMDLSGSANLILNDTTKFELATSVFMLLERSNECVNNRINLKHGVLLSGKYGTGKTLTAKVIAQKATNNDWTFIYLKSAADLAAGLRMAQLYAPAVIFVEDVDQVASGERDEQLNELLNTLDGVDTKTQPILTVLTTNHPERIQPAFIRAGRIDTVIQFEEPDAKTCLEFVRLYARDDEGRDLLKPDSDLTKAGELLAGMVPAFICEAVGKAKRFAIHRCGNDIVGQMEANDVELAAKSIHKHLQMANRTTEVTATQKVGQALGAWVSEMVDEKTEHTLE